MNMNVALSDLHADPGAPDSRIALTNIVKEYHTPLGTRRVLDNVSFQVRKGEKIAILGRNGAGKSTLVKIIGGVERPTSGQIRRDMSMSWPLAFGGGFEVNMSGMDNIRFIARIYNAPLKQTIDFCDDFAELGKLLFLPVRTYSSGMRARLAFALTLAIDFDCMLIDEVISVGDQRFHAKCHEELFVKRKHCAMILVSHDVQIVKEFCNKALILKDGRGKVFEDLDFAISIYNHL
jgi:capsular polysaccharide transport system ATP-binding protein